MKTLALLLAAAGFTVAALQISSACLRLAAVVESMPVLIDRAIERESELTRKQVLGRLDAAANGIILESRQYRKSLDSHLSSALSEVSLGREQAVQSVDRLQGSIDSALAIVDNHAGGFRQDLSPLISNYAEIPAQVKQAFRPYWDPKGNPAAWPVQATAALGAARATLGEASRTMKVIRETAPALAENSTRTSEETAHLMHNLAETFKPLPKYLRIPLAIAAPSAQVATPFILRILGPQLIQAGATK